MAKVRIDKNACHLPGECLFCLQSCPAKVFAIHPSEERSKTAKTTTWQVIPVFESLCTACGECLQFCPQKAISING